MAQQQDQAAMFRDLMRAVHDLGRRHAPASGNNTGAIVEQFCRFKPHSFDRKADPLAAEEWLRGLEWFFKHMERTNTQKFKEEAMKKCFSQSLRDRREAEFLQLKKGKMPLEDYERKFEQLSRYALHLVDTEAKKAKRFELGLRPEIGGIMASHHTTTYSEWNGLNIRKGFGQNKKANTGSGSRSSKPNKVIPPCPKCNKGHRGECWFGKNVCYRCGQEGHFAPDCKAYPPKKDYEQNKKGKARVFALTQEEATKDPNVMTGILSVSELPAYVFIDSGAIQSFVSTAFIAKSCIPYEKLDSVLEVTIPLGRTLNTNRIAREWIMKDEVMKKYFPQSLRDRREAEFLQLKQGKMLLEDYERKFEELSRYALHLVDIEAKKAKRFELGLRPEIGGIIASHHTTTYREILQPAQSISDRLEMDRMIEKSDESFEK
ncbi:uncharacterized protein LOC111380932 [Olea europaea var. sylvestris]|uniref:uncharacterized protein LOC111380932 n=1 Tax=Olea europaea var. sylvestris TaxID=158386 RepID=UPI000C1CE10F|nr:uncharacterized protein LOC111380932 [Olea europaea var. sylvestris]